MNQNDFSSQVGISQATLSELEQDKYKPSVETLTAIVTEFRTDLTWLLFGKSNSINKVIGINEVNEKEADLLMHFEKLKEIDQDEIIEFIKMKINRY